MTRQKRVPAVFLDRDGTLLNERGYLSDPNKMKIYPFVTKALRPLQKKGFRLVLITNQSGIGRRYFKRSDVDKVHQQLKKRLWVHKIRLAGIYLCPHHPSKGCLCRKPLPGLPKKAARDLNLNLKESYVIGDQVRDMKMAQNIGARAILVLTGAGKQSRKKAALLADKISSNLLTASRWLLKQNQKEKV